MTSVRVGFRNKIGTVKIPSASCVFILFVYPDRRDEFSGGKCEVAVIGRMIFMVCMHHHKEGIEFPEIHRIFRKYRLHTADSFDLVQLQHGCFRIVDIEAVGTGHVIDTVEVFGFMTVIERNASAGLVKYRTGTDYQIGLIVLFSVSEINEQPESFSCDIKPFACRGGDVRKKFLSLDSSVKSRYCYILRYSDIAVFQCDGKRDRHIVICADYRLGALG